MNYHPYSMHPGPEHLYPEQIMDNFCLMMIEDFLKRRGMAATLTTFRTEWNYSEEKMVMSWYEIILRLKLPELMTHNSFSRHRSIMENLVEALIRESSVRSRQTPEVVLTGLASAPRTTSLPQLAEHNYDYHTKIAVNSTTTATESRKKPAMSRTDTVTNFYIKRHLDSLEKLGLVSTNRQAVKVTNAVSSESWIPSEIRMKSIGRDLSAAKETLIQIKKREIDFDREMKRLQVSDLQHARTEEELGATHKIPCGCCKQKFLYVNLPLKVSRKAILDIRIKWSGKLNSATVFGALEAEEEDSSPNRQRKSEDSALLGAVPRCYDNVGVCVFCAQFFHVQEDYRPSYQAIIMHERQAAFLEAKRRETEYWDPLKMVEKDRQLEDKRMMDDMLQFKMDMSSSLSP